MQNCSVKHVLLYVDGNRRWAEKNNLSPELAYAAAGQKLLKIIDFYQEKQVPVVSLYACSTENLRHRSAENKFFFIKAAIQSFKFCLADFNVRSVRIIFIGDKTLLSEETVHAFNTIEHLTAQGNKLTCYFLFGYGGREELFFGLQEIIKVLAKNKSQDFCAELTRLTALMSFEQMRSCMWLGAVPEPDMVIRAAGGISRLSNGPLVHLAYAELFFLDCFWPDLNEQMLQDCWKRFFVSKRSCGS